MKSYIPELRCQTSAARILAAGILISLTAATIAVAADPSPATPPQKGWESAATLGATLTRGNSKTFAASGNVTTRHSWTSDEVLFGATAGYGENTTTVNGTKVDQTTESDIKGFGQWNHLFSPQTYAGLRVTGDHDDIASLAYRVTVSPLLGYYFIKQTNSFLAGEVGPSYVREKYFDEDVHNYIGLRVAERGEHKFASGARIWESLSWIPKVADLNNYLLNMEAGVSAPISKALSVSLILQDTYNNAPAAGKLKNDLKLIAGLSYIF